MSIWKYSAQEDRAAWSSVDYDSWGDVSGDSFDTTPDGGDVYEVNVLEDFSLKLGAFAQAFDEDFALPSWATDGTWFNDMQMPLSAYYQAYEDLKTKLTAYYQAFDENFPMKLYAAATAFDDFSLKLFAATLELSDFQMKLLARAYAFDDFMWKASASGYGFDDLMMKLEAVSGIVISDMMMKLYVTDGVYFKDFPLKLVTVTPTPQYKITVAQRLSSVIS